MSSRLEELLSEHNRIAARKAALQARDHFVAWRRSRLGLRGALLYVLPLPLPLAGIIALAKGQWTVALACAAAFAVLMGGAQLTRRGIREELLAPARRYTRPARVSFKYLGAALVAAGTALTAFAVVGQGIVTSVVYALVALIGYHLVYRLPPQGARAAGQRTPVTGDERLRRALAQAEQRILAIETAADTIGNTELAQRLLRIATQARTVLDMIAERPAELFRARKFLSVYLEGAERVASHYARTHRLAGSPVLEQNFRSALVEIESVFERQRSQLLEHDVTDLDIQIEVLRQRLEREGIG